jgi:hypothetical protein
MNIGPEIASKKFCDFFGAQTLHLSSGWRKSLPAGSE